MVVLDGARRGAVVRRSEQDSRMHASGVNDGCGAFMHVIVLD